MRIKYRRISLVVGVLLVLGAAASPAHAQAGPQCKTLYCPVYWEGSIGYALYQFNSTTFPDATTGSITNSVPGALGQPNTVVLDNGAEPGRFNGVLANFTLWLDMPGNCLDAPKFVHGIDGSFFMTETRTATRRIASDSSGSPLLARPFFNTSTGLQDAQLRSFIGRQGSISDSLSASMMGAELSLKGYDTSWYWYGGGVKLLAGGRWLNFNETYSNFDISNDLGGGGFSRTFSDSFDANNQFFGGQIGCELEMELSRLFTLSLMGKVAFGPNRQTIDIKGETVQVNNVSGVTTVDSLQGFYAQPNNVGQFYHDQLTMLSELSAKLRFDIASGWNINASYGILILSNAIRATDQVSPNLTIQPIGPDSAFTRIEPSFVQSVLRAQTLNIGVEIQF